jgi:4-hydroxybutyryl-CoA dehydratase/vinylacetyl-CoA-Delta-isomerase
MARLAQDLAGGLMSTLPSAKDLANPATGEYLRKYLKGVTGVAVAESMHGAGSPQTQRVVIGRQAPLDEYKEAAKALAGIDASSFRGAGGDMAPPHGLGA